MEPPKTRSESRKSSSEKRAEAGPYTARHVRRKEEQLANTAKKEAASTPKEPASTTAARKSEGKAPKNK
jgi:hypothetical protein